MPGFHRFVSILTLLFVLILPSAADAAGTMLIYRNIYDSVFSDDVRDLKGVCSNANITAFDTREGETFLDMVDRTEARWSKPVMVYWFPGHGGGWNQIGGQCLSDLQKFVLDPLRERGTTLDLVISGVCHSGFIEFIGAWNGVADYVIADVWLAYYRQAERLIQYYYHDGYIDFQGYLASQNYMGKDYETSGTILSRPARVMELLEAIREGSPRATREDCLEESPDYGTETNIDIWPLVEKTDTEQLWHEAFDNGGAEIPDRKGTCGVSCWDGKLVDLYTFCIPEELRVVSVPTPTPVPTEQPDTTTTGGCTVATGAAAFPWALLLVAFPAVTVCLTGGRKKR